MALSKVGKNQVDQSASLTVDSDLTVDTNTLYVDSANNRVGVGVSDPSQDIDLVGSSNTGSGSVRAGGAGSGTQAAFIAQAQFGSASFGTYASYPAVLNSSNSPMVYFNTNASGRAVFVEGITFNGDTAAANALDDYEEGTFTPTLYHSSTNNSTFSSVNGEYTKIGNTVTCQLRIDGGNSGTAGSFLVIGGLPFAVSQAQGNMGIGIWGSNPSQQVGNIHGFNPPRVFKGGQDVTTQMTFFTAMLVYKTS